MSEKIRRKLSAKRKKTGSSKVLLICLACGGGVVLLIVGVALFFVLVKGFNPLGRGVALELPNSKVTENNYVALKHGFSLAEVEAILGKGRPPTSGDFDAICGKEDQRFTNPFFKDRATWEENNRRGMMLIWTNGQTRLLTGPARTL